MAPGVAPGPGAAPPARGPVSGSADPAPPVVALSDRPVIHHRGWGGPGGAGPRRRGADLSSEIDFVMIVAIDSAANGERHDQAEGAAHGGHILINRP